MSKITKIEYQKKNERVNLYIDGLFFCGLMTETLLANSLKVGLEVNEEKLKSVIFESEVRRASNYAFGLVAKRPYTSSEIVKKVKLKGFSDEVAKAVANKLIDYKYVDDEKFAESFVAACGLKSKRQIAQKLMQKGIEQKVIADCVSKINNDDESLKIERVIEKYCRNQKLTQEFFQKLFRYLSQKGFDFDLIKSEISKLKQKGGFDDESWD